MMRGGEVVTRKSHKLQIVGSNPSRPTSGRIAQVVRALHL